MLTSSAGAAGGGASLPLHGVRVLDLTNVIAGPLASYQLAMLGAEVIKIEVPGRGDLARIMGADPGLSEMRMGASFCAMNAGKKSITLNLKRPQGLKIFMQLVESADAVIENFRPGIMKKLGADYEALSKANPRLVYCAVSGFGQDGPLSGRPSYDQIIQGFSGIMSLTGDPDGEPTRAGYVVCDTIAAMTAAFALVAALYRQQKTGQGEMIDVSMLDASLATMAAWPVSNYLNGGHVPRRMGNHNPAGCPSGTFPTADGELNIVNNEQHQFERLCDALGLAAFKTDPRFRDRASRARHRDVLHPAIVQALSKKTTAEWEAIFVEAGVPAGPILTVPEVLDHPQIRGRQLVKRFADAHGMGRDIAVTRTGFRLQGSQPDVHGPPPRLGQDNAEILGGLGYTPRQLEALRQQGVI
ncbi:CoA transferase [Pigmentiphaga soli]|uniref:CoA transferase n=1 Tax=Pigmentiphaga soli TaxID=1007095 RepID=A0ABP8H878_9BURK